MNYTIGAAANIAQQQQPTAGMPDAPTQSMEEYNSDKSVLRLTTDRVPASSTLMKEVALPIACVVKPFGEPATGEEVDCVSFGEK